MKKLICCVLLVHLVMSSFSQNLLSPEWDYHKLNPDGKPVNSGKVNLLLSWERQGYCELDGACEISRSFRISRADLPLQLDFSFVGEVTAVFINNIKVAGRVPNGFWSRSNQFTTIHPADSVFHPDRLNTIRICFAAVGYTGGRSHNSCFLHSPDAKLSDSLAIDFPVRRHLFEQGEKQSFTIHSKTTKNQQLQLLIRNDFGDTLLVRQKPIRKGEAVLSFDFSDRPFPPGFYECIAIAGGKTYEGTVGWFAVQPRAIKCKGEKPAGFDAYWHKALKELSTVEPGYQLMKIDSLCSATRDGYVVEMNSLNHFRIKGYLFIPKSKGKYPAILHLPGYNQGFYDLSELIGNQESVIDLALCVRGHGISREGFSLNGRPTLWAVGIDHADQYIYRSIYMDCVRAVEFLRSQPEVDSLKIGVCGGSQGGGLALATAGLCGKAIAACAVFDPWLCDFRDQAKIRPVIPKELASFSESIPSKPDPKEFYKVLDLVDVRFFADRISCPLYFTTSLFDDDCPPHCGFSVYNRVRTAKQFKVYPNDSHLGESGQYAELPKLLTKQLSGKSVGF